MTNETVLNNTQYHSLTLTPYHEAYDQDKLQALVADMIANGWVGAPLVKFDDQLLTGSHRYRAAELAELDHIPVVDYKDVFCVDDADEIVNDCELWVVELTYAALDSDPEIAEELGMDAH